ncbi:MAG: NAD(P)-binding domain-containing protein, partial [Actinomycetota bacterium]|nr:NAD(P)-binding domain-containing protein [Actinomycetota bacterium]
RAVADVLFGADGVAAGARSGALVVDASTIGPDAARGIAARLAHHRLRYVDAPVMGSVAPATQGTLGVLAGGTDGDVAQARPLMEAWGDPERVLHVGPVGSASGLKLAVNLVMDVLAEGVGEALRLVADLGLDREVALRALGAGPAGWILQQKREMLESGDFIGTTFSLDLLAKDLDLAAAAGARDLPAVRVALGSARAAGSGGQDYAALIGWLERASDPDQTQPGR